MKHYRYRKIKPWQTAMIIIIAIIIASGAFALAFFEDEPMTEAQETVPEPELVTEAEIEPEQISEKKTEVKPEPKQEEPKAEKFTISFAGDCTLGTDHGSWGSARAFGNVMNGDYSYPFALVADYFKNDDMTIVNLEGALTEASVPAEKLFRFKGDPDWAKVLTAGGVDFVTLANNHSYDYGKTGYNDTKAALESEGIGYCENASTSVYTMDCGITVGIYAANFPSDTKKIAEAVGELDASCDIVICAFHWGDEGKYAVNANQRTIAHAAIDAGCDIVYGSHPHVLQQTEKYENGVIYYSMGNFVFGGNSNPKDKDTAIIRQGIIREVDGTVHLGDTICVVCSLSSAEKGNNYQPVPLESGTAAYFRAWSKLNGTYDGPDIVRDDTERRAAMEAEKTAQDDLPEEESQEEITDDSTDGRESEITENTIEESTT